MKFLIFSFVLLFSGNSYALRPPVSIEAMVEDADAIVVARFEESTSSKIYSDRLGDLYLANFQVLGAFKGFDVEMSQSNEFSVLWRKGVPENPNFEPGETYILYLRYSEIGPYIASGSRGAVKITKQSLHEAKKVQEIIKKTNARKAG
jgi:hypothetical protein